MEKQIAYCGLDCIKCLAYIATQENSDEKRRETSIQWKKEFNLDIKPEEINCDGCLTENVGNIHCPIRKCGQEKGVINCAYCEDYICATLDKYFQTVPFCKDILDGIKKGIKIRNKASKRGEAPLNKKSSPSP